MSMKDYQSRNGDGQQVSYNPLRPYYTPGLHQQHNYTSLPSSDTIPGHTPQVFIDDDEKGIPLKSTTTKFTSFAAFKYFMTMCTSPFEVGTTLLQVQYAPHESVEVLGSHETSALEEEEETINVSFFMCLESKNNSVNNNYVTVVTNVCIYVYMIVIIIIIEYTTS